MVLKRDAKVCEERRSAWHAWLKSLPHLLYLPFYYTSPAGSSASRSRLCCMGLASTVRSCPIWGGLTWSTIITTSISRPCPVCHRVRNAALQACCPQGTHGHCSMGLARVLPGIDCVPAGRPSLHQCRRIYTFCTPYRPGGLIAALGAGPRASTYS